MPKKKNNSLLDIFMDKGRERTIQKQTTVHTSI